MKLNVFITLTLLYSGVVLAQDSKLVFSLHDAQNYAIENSKVLKGSRDGIRLAREQYKETLGAGLPSANATVDYMTNFNDKFNLDFGGGASSSITMEDQASANFQVNQLIFSGQYWAGLKLSKISQLVSEKSYDISELDIKEQVTNTYYLILITEEFLKVIDDNEKNLLEVYTHTANMFKVGMAERTDVDQIKINLSELRNSKETMKRNLQLNYNMFRFQMGIESNDEIVLTQGIDELLGSSMIENATGDTFNMEANPSYQIMEAQEMLGQKNLTMQKWAYSPTITGFYSYKEKILTTGFDMTPKNTAGLSLSIPLFSGGTRNAQLSQRQIELEQITREKSLLEDQLVLQNNQLLYEYQSSYENYLTQKENVDVAKRVYGSFNNKYQQGLVSSLDLTQANTNYLQAENNYLTAMVELLQAKLALNKLYNTL